MSTRLRQHDARPSLGATLEFMRLLWELEHALQRHSKRMAKELGLTAPQCLALRLVGRFPGIPAGELAALLHLHPSTVTGILARLEERGWIARRSDPRDGRRILIGLTERGRTLDGVVAGTPEARLERALARLPAAEVAAARSLLGTLAGELALAPPAPAKNVRARRAVTSVRSRSS